MVVGILAGWIAERITGPYIAGFLVNNLLGFRYVEVAKVVLFAVATLGAVLLLAIFRRLPKRTS